MWNSRTFATQAEFLVRVASLKYHPLKRLRHLASNSRNLASEKCALRCRSCPWWRQTYHGHSSSFRPSDLTAGQLPSRATSKHRLVQGWRYRFQKLHRSTCQALCNARWVLELSLRAQRIVDYCRCAHHWFDRTRRCRMKIAKRSRQWKICRETGPSVLNFY